MRKLHISKLLAMGFGPPLITIIVYICVLSFRNFVPPFLLFLICALFILAPLEFIVLLRENKKETGKIGMSCALGYNCRLNKWKALLLIIILFCIAGIAIMFVGTWEDSLIMPIVNKYVPDYFIVDNFINQLEQYPKYMIKLTAILFFIANGFVLPIVEELYFRGYMMPRLKRFKAFAPIIVTVIFSLYHFWLPWQNMRRIVGVLPYTYVVWKKENIYIGMVVHCLCNLVGSIQILLMVF